MRTWVLVFTGVLMHSGMAASEVKTVDGVRMVYVPDPDLGIVHFEVLFEGGSLRDPEGQEGVANLTANMLLRGTPTKTYQQIMDEVNYMGAELDSVSAREFFGLAGSFMPRFRSEMEDLLREVLGVPSFPENEFETERSLVVEELVNIRNEDAELARYFFTQFLYRGHPLGRPRMGFIDTVKGLKAKDCQDFYKKYARKETMIMVLSGSIGRAEAEEFVRRVAELVPSGEVEAVFVPPPPKVEGVHVLIVDKPERTQTQVVMGHPSLGWRDPDLFPVLVGNTAFGGTFTSRLMREIREKRGWSYGVSSIITAGREFGTLAISFFPASQDTVKAIGLAMELVREVSEKGLSEEEVKFAQNHLANQFPFRVETARKRAEEEAANILLGRDKEFLDKYIERVRAETVESVNRAMAKWFHPNDMVVVVVGTARALEGEIRSLPNVVEVVVHPFDKDRL